MDNDRSTPVTPDDASTEIAAGDEFNENDPMDKYDAGVMAADATGMLAGERLITVAEIVEGDPDLAPGLMREVPEP